MGHYDDIIERREDEERAARAKSLGISLQELHDRGVHSHKMAEGLRLWRKQQAEQASINYYLKHSSVVGLEPGELSDTNWE